MGMNTRPLLVAIPLLLAGCGASPTEAYAPAAYATQPQQLTADPGEDLVGPLTPTAKALARKKRAAAALKANLKRRKEAASDEPMQDSEPDDQAQRSA